MRPGREAPENAALKEKATMAEVRFNEAGARSPGKPPCAAGIRLGGCASMRPGREAPENVGVVEEFEVRVVASMRPGREAPENHLSVTTRPRSSIQASMRPGREAPENPANQILVWLDLEASMRPGREAPENLALATASIAVPLLQ